jgi:hypothetical protein
MQHSGKLMKKHIERLVLLIFVGFLFNCIFIGVSRANLGGAELQGPKDQYLVGIDTILVWSGTPLDNEMTTQGLALNNIPKIDLGQLNQTVAKELSSALNSYKKNKLTVQVAIRHNNKNGYPTFLNDEHTILLTLTFGFHVVKLNGQELVLAAMYPTIERLLPTALMNDRAGGFDKHFTGAFAPAPFILSVNKELQHDSLEQATQRIVSGVAEYINGLAIEGANNR